MKSKDDVARDYEQRVKALEKNMSLTKNNSKKDTKKKKNDRA